jgi:hypothetical protein
LARIVAIPAGRARYAAIIQEVRRGPGKPSALTARAAALWKILSPLAASDPKKPYTMQQIADSLDEMNTFFMTRDAALTKAVGVP